MLFERVSDGQVYKTMTILMRVDSQINDKDLRDKRKAFKNYNPLDFGIEESFCMMTPESFQATSGKR